MGAHLNSVDMPYDEWSDKDKEKELYKQYYETSRRDDEWSALEKENISKRIEHLREIESWNSGGD